VSGCLDDQTSADAMIGGTHTGAMTFALRSVMNETEGHPTFEQLFVRMRRKLASGGYSQLPQLSALRPFELSNTFLI